MSFDKNLTASTSLAEQFRDQFPVTERFIYLNHAAVAPLSRSAANAMKVLADEVAAYGSFHYERWLETYQGVRTGAARLIGADPHEIAIMKNTSEGIATVANGLDWRVGERMVGFREEFPSNLLPWQRLESRGVSVDWLSIYDPPDRIDEACRGARLLAISYVNYLSGFRADLQALGEICQRRGCFFFVDAIQGMGAFPLDVEAAHIDGLAADGHKWMLGPEGCAILYLRKERQDEVQPVEFGWTNVADYASYGTDSTKLRTDAGRYEPGTLNTVGCYGLRAALDLIHEIGVGRISGAVLALADRIAEGARAKGYELLVQRSPSNSAGIVSFRKSGADSRMIVRKIKESGILAAPRMGWVRTSPHFYIRLEEIDRMVEELP